jgi:hypothetical protein
MSIKLGTKIEPMSIPTAKDMKPKAYVDYPSVMLEFRDGDDPKIPASGTITFHFARKSKREETVNKDGKVKENCSYRLELHSIEDMEGGGRMKPTEEALDELMEQAAPSGDYD